VHKPAGRPCPKLGTDHRCTIHSELRERGWQGCAAFDCFGAGQRITALRGDWRDQSPHERSQTFAAWQRLVGLHQLLWHLHQAAALGTHDSERAELEQRVEAAVDADRADPSLRSDVNNLLINISAAHRSPPGPDLSRAMRLGAKLQHADLRRASLFAACLIGADLRQAELRGADLRGADLRGADLRGADLRGVLFLVPGQLSSARGNRQTRLDGPRPEHWA
jgi:hypothetical protein